MEIMRAARGRGGAGRAAWLRGVLLAAVAPGAAGCARDHDHGGGATMSAGPGVTDPSALASASAALAQASASAALAQASASAAMAQASASAALASALAASSLRGTGIGRAPHGFGCSQPPPECVATRVSARAPGPRAAAPFARCAARFATSTAGLGGLRARGGTAAATAPFDHNATANRVLEGFDECCYREHRFCGGGRPLRDASGAPVLAAIVGPSVLDTAPAGDGARRALAAHWLRAAQHEHASVAAFARFSLDLLGLGAPAALLEGAQRAALDELAHARDALDVATAFAGATVTLGPMPLGEALGARPPASATNPASITRFVRETLLDGALGESFAAAEALASLERAEEPAVRAALERVARDEATHAALAFRTLAWALGAFGAPARAALEAALAGRGAAAAALVEAPAVAYAGDPRALARGGLRSPDARAQERARTLRLAVRPALAALLGAPEALAARRRRGAPVATASAG